jgi:hypothetical protein
LHFGIFLECQVEWGIPHIPTREVSMAVAPAASNSVPAPAPARQPEAKQVVDRPADKAAQATPPPQAPRPVVNTSGQTTGTTINTSA